MPVNNYMKLYSLSNTTKNRTRYSKKNAKSGYYSDDDDAKKKEETQ